MEKKILLMPLGVLLAVLIAAIIVPLFVNADSFKPAIIDQLRSKTGYDIAIDGPITIRLLPSARLRVEKVAVASPLLNANAPFARMEFLDVGVRILPLMQGDIEIIRIQLNNPTVTLLQNQVGNNWSPRQAAVAAVLEGVDEPGERLEPGMTPRNIVLRNIEIVNGSVKYTNLRSKKELSLTSLDVKAGMDGLVAPFDLKAKAFWNQKPFELTAKVDSLGMLLSNVSVPAQVSFDSQALKLSLKGNIESKTFRGMLELRSGSINDAVAWLSGVKPAGGTTVALDIASQASCNQNQCKLTDSVIKLNDNTLKGGVEVDISQPRLTLAADLQSDKVDITSFMAKKTAGLQLINSAWADSARWSEAPIDYSFLSSADVTATLRLAHFVADTFEMADVNTRLKIFNNTLSTTISSESIYSGKAKLSLIMGADRRGDVTLGIDGVQMEPLLKAVADSDRFSGKGAVRFAGGASMRSQRDIVSTLTGNGSADISDGSINGVDIAGMVRNVKSAFTEVDKTRRKTDFAELGGTYTIANGIVTNNDLAMKAPLFRVSGKGEVNLPQYTINYLLTPQLVDTLKGQGGKDKEGLAVPIRVSGSLEDPKFAPDLTQVIDQAIRDPKQFKENAKELRGSVKDMLKQGKGILKGL